MVNSSGMQTQCRKPITMEGGGMFNCTLVENSELTNSEILTEQTFFLWNGSGSVTFHFNETTPINVLKIFYYAKPGVSGLPPINITSFSSRIDSRTDYSVAGIYNATVWRTGDTIRQLIMTFGIVNHGFTDFGFEEFNLNKVEFYSCRKFLATRIWHALFKRMNIAFSFKVYSMI